MGENEWIYCVCTYGNFIRMWDPRILWAVEANVPCALKRGRQGSGISERKWEIHRQMSKSKHVVNKVLLDNPETMGDRGSLTNRLAGTRPVCHTLFTRAKGNTPK